jgi:hypothetical protein
MHANESNSPNESHPMDFNDCDSHQTPERCTFDYAVIRVVPRVEREEFMNVGVIVYCAERGFLAAKVELDSERLKAFAPHLDAQQIEDYLQTIPLICDGGQAAGPIGASPQRARFHWLVAPRSTLVQTSPVHCGLSDNPAEALECLMNKLVRLPSTH